MELFFFSTETPSNQKHRLDVNEADLKKLIRVFHGRLVNNAFIFGSQTMYKVPPSSPTVSCIGLIYQLETREGACTPTK